MQTQEKDIYDLEVERLTREPELIDNSWSVADPLFKVVGKGFPCGCLTQIRLSDWREAKINDSPNYALEAAIREDTNIPKHISDITPAHLPHFAKWQRRIDRMNAGESFEEVMESTK